MTGHVLLVRHGQTDWSDTGRVQGWAPVPLNERGRDQSREAASLIVSQYDVDHIISSDLRRARETAEEIAEATPDATFETDLAWRERDFGIYQGLDDEYLDTIDYPEEIFSKAPESGESWEEVSTRVEGAWSNLVASIENTVTVVVSHFGPIVLLLGIIKGEALGAQFNNSVPTCSIQQIEVDADGIISLNQSSTSEP